MSRVVFDSALGIEDHRWPPGEIISGPARLAGAREADEGVHDAVAHRLPRRRRIRHRAEAEADIVGVLRALEIELIDESRRASLCARLGLLDLPAPAEIGRAHV